uniref:NADH dehydrogenase subunit 2 n=1 Tax=Tupiella akineta TaxID=160070 RepID=Q6UVT1_TUPAK|nr:NADH dehydrogenase subunit 2 [Tupiella akineta]AAQ18743.1 NADH dehydrogenase subunit 2 [Tupiella akineta]
MTEIDFILIIPELFQLILINIFLLYALFFSGLGQSNQIISGSLNSKQQEGGLSLLHNYTQNKEAGRRPQQLIRAAYLATPLQIVEPLSWLIVISLIFSTALFLNSPVSSAVLLTSSFICDDFATLFKVVLCLSSAAAIALAIPAFNSSTIGARINNYEFLLVIYLAIFGMLCLISSYNFLTFYLSIELQSLSFYLLACSKSRSEFSAEAGLKYFILGAFSSAILLFGISLIYGSIGSIYFDDVGALLEFSNYSKSLTNLETTTAFETGNLWPHIGLAVGLACICISLLFKLAAVPFHMWAPDVYEGSPTGITAFFAITAKIAALAVLARFVIATEQLLIPALSFVTMASLVVGTLSAMRQVKIKRLIAFSGVSNVGWFLMGLCSGRLDAVLLHLIIYITLSVTLFSIIIQPIHRLGGSGLENRTIKHITDLGQIYKTNTMVALALTLTLFSLGGIPLLAGFYSKYLIINAAIQAEALGLLTIGLLSAVFSAFYYIRVVKTVYFSELGGDWFSFEAPSTTNAYLIAVSTFFTTLFVVYPESISIWLINISL